MLGHAIGGSGVCGAKIQQNGAVVAAADHDIVRADVAVNDAAAMHLGQSRDQGEEVAAHLLPAQRRIPMRNKLREGLTVDILHDDVDRVVGLEGGMDLHDVRLRGDAGDGAAFSQGAPAAAGEIILAVGIGLQRMAGAVAGRHLPGEVFLDRHAPLQGEVDADVSDAEAAVPLLHADEVLVHQHSLREVTGAVAAHVIIVPAMRAHGIDSINGTHARKTVQILGVHKCCLPVGVFLG